MADSGRPRPADPDAADSRTSSPLTVKRRAQQSPGLRPKYQSPAPGHCFRKVTLTKPTFCHSCSDFIWGLVGFLCEVCNFMCHEKCLKTLRTVCSCMSPSSIRVPVAHCFGSAGPKKRFCCVCRKQTEGNAVLRCEVCELHVHADCAAFTCADCRSSHLDGTLEQDTSQHHWREGNLASAARCEVCRRSCGSSDVLAGMRCEWCSITVRTSQSQRSLPHRGSDALSRSAHSVRKHEWLLSTVLQKKKNDKNLAANVPQKEAALRSFYLPDEPHDVELHEVGGMQRLHSDDVLNRNGGSLKDGGDAWVLRTKPRDHDVIQVFAGWARSASVSVSISGSSTTASVLAEVLKHLNRQDEDVSNFSLLEVCMSSKQVQRQTLTPQEKILDKLQEIRKVSLRQMNQTRFYAVQNQNRTVQVNLLIGGLPPLLAKEEYVQLIQENLDIKSHLVTISHIYSSQGAVALLISCFAEAERIYMLAKDTSVSNKPLTSLVIPEILHDQLGADVCPLLVFVNPKSGGLKGRELLYSFRKLLNPHQVFDISNGGPLAGIVQMNNYFGIGIDAELSLDFHLAREDEPDKFTSRFHNKGVYVKVGLQKISHTRSLHKELQLQVDAQNVALPNIEGLIFLNIPSWGSGADLWGSEGDGRFGKPSIDDGLLEVVGVTGVVHMGQVQSGLRSGIRIAQGNYIRLTVSKPIPVQVDGEPWIQPPGHIIISAAGPKVRMLRKSKQKQKKSSANVRNGCSESPSSRDEGH
ncbi:diacylglycerol kinase theta [Stegastes partitus]|uniref:diacylglycerol kinase (ATP) n=1 Tax=Stegastes partitus TaxID=144197 RepID=A0A9Y4K2Z5_9TELE|nr:PREDICTED: diacylglycerol kinase theta [Stegastes partitus]